MKQPENSIDAWLAGDFWQVDVNEVPVTGGACISAGSTRESALKAAKRRLERLKCDVARELDELESKGKS